MTLAATKDDGVKADDRAAIAQKNNTATPETGVRCELDGVWVHSIFVHLKGFHPEVSLSQYRLRYPDADIESAWLREIREKREAEKRGATDKVEMTTKVVPFVAPGGAHRQPMHKVFGMRASKEFEDASGNQVEIFVYGDPSSELAVYLAEVDPNYVFQPDMLRDINLALTLNIPVLVWGLHGTGKTTAIEQYMARTNRPWIRVQHTVSTEEAHVLGQYRVCPDPVTGENTMVFEPGPLAYAMRYGLVYCADEYDFALPSVTSVYQPVLEGKALLIKEAPPEWRMVKPHPNFRFFATGNTNGSGDETGLYQGTQIMNAANYSRFGMTLQVNYMKPDLEASVISKQGQIKLEDAKKLVQFAKSVRDAYAGGQISVTVSPRELINAALIGLAKGGQWREGLRKAYLNRLSTTDRKAVDDFAQRVFGGTID